MALDIELTAGTLAPPACYQTEQERLDAFVAATTATATGGVQWQAGTIAPSDLTLYWLVTDVNGRPLDVLKYSVSDGAWVRVLSEIVFCGDAGSTAINDLTVAPVPTFLTSASAYQYGRMYVFKCPNNTTGAVTIRVNGLAQKAITKRGTTALASGDLVVGQMVFIVYDGTQFQLLSEPANTTVAVADIAPGTDRQFLRTAAGPVTQWESGYITQLAGYQNIPSAGNKVELSHLLGADPISWQIGILCVVDDAGYLAVPGHFIPVNSILRTDLSESDLRCSGYSDSSVLGFVRTNTAITLAVNHRTTGALTAITENSWRVVGRAIR